MCVCMNLGESYIVHMMQKAKWKNRAWREHVYCLCMLNRGGKHAYLKANKGFHRKYFSYVYK